MFKSGGPSPPLRSSCRSEVSVSGDAAGHHKAVTDGNWLMQHSAIATDSQTFRHAGLLGSTNLSSTGAMPKIPIVTGSFASPLTPS
jgi:hypothetical protein